MYVEANRAIARYVAEAAWNQGRLEVIDEVFAPDFVNHDPSAHQVRNAKALKRWIERLRIAFPDMHMTIEDLIAEEDMIVTVSHLGYVKRNAITDSGHAGIQSIHTTHSAESTEKPSLVTVIACVGQTRIHAAQ